MAATSPEGATSRFPFRGVRVRSRAEPAAIVSVAVLLVLAVPLAAPGPALVPGAGADEPRWILGIYGQGLGVGAGLYLALLYLAGAAWVGAWLGASRLGPRIVWGVAGIVLTLFALAPPLLSLDVFSYIAYGRLGVEGFNPYEFVPADLPGDPAADRVEDFRFTPSVYGPAFTMLTYPLASVGAGFALWALKAIAVLSIVALGVLTARLGRLRGVDPAAAAAFVVLNPLVLVHLVGGAHNDALMVAIATAGVLAAAGGRPLTAGAALVGATAIKVSGALYLPFAVAGSPDRRRLTIAIAVVAGVVAGAGLALFGGAVTEALGVASSNQSTTSRWSVPATLSRITGLDLDLLRAVFAVAYGLAVAGLLVRVVGGADWIRAAGWAAFGLLVATSWLVPWYIVWLLPLAAVSRDRALQAGAIGLTTFQSVNALPL